MKHLILYTTLGCHLCEDAKKIIWPVLSDHDYQLKEIDIATSEPLIERYGIKIPVVKCEDKTEELCWPFDTEQLQVYLSMRLTR